MEEAALRKLCLRAVTAFEPPDLWLFTSGLSADVPALREVRTQVEALVAAVTEARTRRGAPVPPHADCRAGLCDRPDPRDHVPATAGGCSGDSSRTLAQPRS